MSRYDILIATRNSADRIGRTLNSLSEMLAASGTNTSNVRVLVINNASTDQTLKIVEGFKDKLSLEIIDAPEPGKSRALNVAVEDHLRGEIIFFSDDDVTFAPDWLDQFVSALDANPDYSIFAGRITGTWEKEVDPDLASWIPMGSTYAVHTRTDSGSCEPGLVWGPNMAVRRSVFDAGLRFNPAVGPQPGKLYPMGQDTEFSTRVVRAGFKSYFVADALVVHTIKAATANEDWVIKRAERLGYGIFAVKQVNEVPRSAPAFVPLGVELWGKSLLWKAFFPLTNFMPRGKHRFWCRWRRYYYDGLWKGYNVFVRSRDKDH